jgi:two-component system C4-dicarboxylate transport sensor histidine kinase DctB
MDLALWVSAPSSATILISVVALALGSMLALLLSRSRERHLLLLLEDTRAEIERLRLQFDSVRDRAAQLREQLSAADRQARLSNQLTVLGQFTAGFLHEFNNPLAIVAGRIEVLLEERKEDASLCADLQHMLKETRYMGNVARTLLQALRHERGEETFTAPVPAEVLRDTVAALGSSAEKQRAQIIVEAPDVPPVDLPDHVVGEVVRGLISNALEALKGREDGAIWLRLEPYRTPGSKVVLRVEDNGPGVPESIREHLFEPFISQSPGRERLGLGLFLAASLMDTYDGSVRYETRNGGGASFVVEMPPARFTRGQPYHWFVKGSSE